MKENKQVCISPWRDHWVYEMGIVNTIFGRRAYRVKKDPLSFFFVEAKPNHEGFYEIKVYDLNAEKVTSACWGRNEEFLWWYAPKFKSFIQAVAWLKKNHQDLF